MERKHILHLVSSDPQVSPFDINMAYDAGFDAVIPYAGVEVSTVSGLVQDVMFSRGPKGARYSAIFFSGSDVSVAEGMLSAARAALFDPFRVGLMIDPRGGYTTAAALLAKVAALVISQRGGDLSGRTVLVAAGTGGVGRAAAAMAAHDGAEVILTSRRADSAAKAVEAIASLYEAQVEGRAAPSEGALGEMAAAADVVLSTASAGVQLLSRRTVQGLRGPKVLADVNAVPPGGIEGLRLQDDGAELAPGVLGVGALAIGGLKFQIESSLLKDLLSDKVPPVIDGRAARERAARILAQG